jgi:succinyl-CoA synthetase beta subunit
METFHVQTQKGSSADSAAGAKAVADKLLLESPGCDLILKAQIHAGGRGKGHFINTGLKGGVKILSKAEEVETNTQTMLGDYLVTKQTSEQGQQVNTVLVNEGISIEKEWYFAILLDRGVGGPVMVVSTEGGMNIEEVAETSPEKIVSIPIDIMSGCTKEHGEQVADALKITDPALREKCGKQAMALYDMFISTDATQVEINPLALASDGKIYCVDAKLNFDDNAAFRHKDIFAQRDVSMEDPRDIQAEKFGLNYIGLEGSIGCMVNGAGLAMATMDIIKLNGGSPANFLDVGGGATKEAVTEAFKILTSDPQVKGLLVNIFGGIMKCDIIASGIIAAYKEVGLTVPLVVRLEGTNVELGIKLLKESGLPIITAQNLDEAASKAVAAVEKLNAA